MEEGENWQAMMASCRKACKILGVEFKEPEYCNWLVGRDYYSKLWSKVRLKRIQEAINRGTIILPPNHACIGGLIKDISKEDCKLCQLESR